MSVSEICTAVGAVAAVLGAAASLVALRVHGRSLRKSGVIARDALDVYAQIDGLVQHHAHLDARGAAMLQMMRQRAQLLQAEALAYTVVPTKPSVYVRIRETSLWLICAATYLFPSAMIWTGLGWIQVPDWVAWMVAVLWAIAFVGALLGLQLYVAFRSESIDSARRAFVEHPERGVPRTYLQATSAPELRELLRDDARRSRSESVTLGFPSGFARFARLVYAIMSLPAWVAAYVPNTWVAVANAGRTVASRFRALTQ